MIPAALRAARLWSALGLVAAIVAPWYARQDEGWLPIASACVETSAVLAPLASEAT